MLKSKKVITFLFFALVLFTSCAAIMDGIRGVNTNALHIGMTKEEAQLALKKKPDNIVAAKNYPENHTVIEVVQYSETDVDTNVKTYWLYFINDKLDKWELASNRHRPII